MMAEQKSLIRYLTHPEVVIDPSIPVPQWRLSPMGRARAEYVAGLGWATRYDADHLQRRTEGDRNR